jgi:hypothetical protein
MPEPVIVPGGAEKFRNSEYFKKLKENIPTIDDLLQETGALIAGGGVLASISPTHHYSRDLDIYIHCRKLPTLLTAVREKYYETSIFKASEYCQSFLRKNGIRFVQSFGGPNELDIMSVRHKRSPLQVVQNFDLTICQIWYDGRDVYATHPEDIQNMTTTLQGDYVRVLLQGNRFLRKRMQKYNARGYEIKIGSGVVIPPERYWEHDRQTACSQNSDKYCSVKSSLEEDHKGKTWARKYLFRVSVGTQLINLNSKYEIMDDIIKSLKPEEGYDSEDYLEDPTKLFEIMPKEQMNEKGYEFLDYLTGEENNNNNNLNNNMEGGKRKQKGGVNYDVAQSYNSNWERDYLNPYKEELLALVGPKGDVGPDTRTSPPWTGFTKKDIEFLDITFNESVHATSLSKDNPEEVLYSMCPVCLKYISHEPQTCMYMTHDCAKESTYYHRRLYNKYKIQKRDDWGQRVNKYVICWCTHCGRICGDHRHYLLRLHDDAPKLYANYGSPYESDCRRTSGGGGTPEKIARFNALRAKAVELNTKKDLGEITTNQAKDQLVEAMWDGPLTTPSNVLTQMQTTKKFAVNNSAFPNNAPKEERVYPNIPYPNVGNPELLPVVHKTATNAFKNHYNVDEENIVQFRHRKADGSVNNHSGEGEQISKSMLFNYVQSTFDQKESAKFGMCWQHPTCTARLYPEELLAIIDQVEEKDPDDSRIYEIYKKAFNEKFAAAVQGGKQKTRTRKGKRKYHRTRKSIFRRRV